MPVHLKTLKKTRKSWCLANEHFFFLRPFLFCFVSFVLFLWDLGLRDLGLRDLGLRDLGSRDLGLWDLGSRDRGLRDLGSRDLGLRVGSRSRDLGLRDLGCRRLRFGPATGHVNDSENWICRKSAARPKKIILTKSPPHLERGGCCILIGSSGGCCI